MRLAYVIAGGRRVLVAHDGDALVDLHAADPSAQTWVIPGAGCLHSEGYNADPAAYGARILDFLAEAFPVQQ